MYQTMPYGQVRSLDHATLGFELNGIMKKIN